jgi:anti-anti-sigma factor
VTISVGRDGSYAVLGLKGDFRGGGESFTELRRRGHEALAESPFLGLDLGRVTFLDSQTLGLFVELLRSAQGRGGEVVLFKTGERTMRWFSLSGLDRIFRILGPGQTPGSLAPAPPPEGRRELLDSVDVERMVTELREALGDAGADGAPAAPGVPDEKTLTEIDRLLASLDEGQG